ncbi:hypothetical protein BC829DRAFT_390482 [Chytridium lagenaria]|nr:hypothetical protein BC829DRAFT_390482 [Chytridium lagenaria]
MTPVEYDKEIQNLSNASVVDLKAELFKTQASFTQEKLKAGSTSIRAVSTKVFKKPANKGVGERAAKDVEASTEHNALQASYVALMRKEKEYENLRKRGERGEDSDDDEEEGRQKKPRGLVDFVGKMIEKGKGRGSSDEEEEEQEESEDPWVETVDQFGRTKIVRKSQVEAKTTSGFVKAGEVVGQEGDQPSLVSSDMRMQQQREQWEAEVKADAEAEPLHFDANREHRTMGVGYYAFSRSESERQRQMDALKNIREETVKSRDRATSAKEARKERLEERRALLKERRAKRNGGEEVREGLKKEMGLDANVEAFLKTMRKEVEDGDE